ncbi:hypothetical protein ACH5RR_013956 [Cinchona calisaya]|uniref:VQ domain-containing protein n=1 Tax=Cinchona calisaya TaxID=153742 RepID=A0ABD3A1H8_9GENT
MEYSSDSYNSSSSTSNQFVTYDQQLEEINRAKTTTTTSSFYSSLHAIRKNPLKPMKIPIAPFPPMKPKVYKVDSLDFKKVVQRLTSAPEFQPIEYRRESDEVVVENVPVVSVLRSRRLEEVAPPALDLSSATLPLCFPSTTTTTERKYHKFSETCGAPSQLGTFSFSPSSLGWCLSPLLSPGTLSLLD